MMLIIRPNNTLQFQFILILMNASEQSFPYFVFKISSYIFWVLLLIFFLYMLCTQMTFDFSSHMILGHLLPIPMNQKHECKGHQIYSKMPRKICKK